MFRAALGALLLVNGLSIFGYATFSRHTELLVQYPWSQPIFENAYWVFARLQIILAFIALASLLEASVRRKWVPALIAAVILSLASELSGTTWGLPFGSYEYTELLGFKIINRVPLLIPFSWFFMGMASFVIAHSLVSEKPLLRCLLAAWILVSWDLTLDPAMSHLAPFWIWNEAGPYYGTPILNLVGWYATGLLIMLSFEWLKVSRWISEVPVNRVLLFYGANLLLPLGIVAAAGLWEAIAVSGLCYGMVAGIYFWKKSRTRIPTIATRFS